MEDICNFDPNSSSARTNKPNEVPRSFCPKEKVTIHLQRLKKRVGFQNHVAHPRPLRDFPVIKKDFELALEATRKIEMNHLSLLEKRHRSGYQFPVLKNNSFLDDLNTSSVKKPQTFPLNNPIFNTLWEKVFAKKNGGIRPMNREESFTMEKGDPSQDAQRIKSRFDIGGGVKYLSRRAPSASTGEFHSKPRDKRNSSCESDVNSWKISEINSTDASIKRRMPHLAKYYSPKGIKMGDNSTLAEILEDGLLQTENTYPISTIRTHIQPDREFLLNQKPQIDPQADERLKYESPLRKKLLMRRMHEQVKNAEMKNL